MKIFVAGASGAIGQPLVAELIRQGNSVTGMTHSDGGAERLKKAGADVLRVSALDAPALGEALRRMLPEIVIDQLTALPKHPSQMAEAATGDRKLRLEGGGNLFRAAQAAGVRRYVQQSTGFFLRAGSGLADETETLAVDASPRVAASAQNLYRTRIAPLQRPPERVPERDQDGRCRASLRILLWPEYLVSPRRRFRGPGAQAGDADHRTR
jgi:nucleoside-diphosphate-sugar epimerase